MSGTIVSINVSSRAGTQKWPVAEAELKADHGIVGDVHAGPGDRQVSLLAMELIEAQKNLLSEKIKSGKVQARAEAEELIRPGAYAENLTTRDIDPAELSLGTRFSLGDKVVLEISKIGKKCHLGCEIYKLLGDCIMPREGLFARVIRGGHIRVGDEVRINASCDSDG